MLFVDCTWHYNTVRHASAVYDPGAQIGATEAVGQKPETKSSKIQEDDPPDPWFHLKEKPSISKSRNGDSYLSW